jgi:Leucine-rich repeat (LRR) protein
MKLYKSLSVALREREEVRYLKLTIKEDQLPPEIFFFSELEELYLEGGITQIPHLGNPFPKLRVLSLTLPNFTGSLAEVFTLPSLENLKIIGTPQKRLLLPIGVVNSRIKFLTIKNCGLESLPEEIDVLAALEEANLSLNELSRLPQSLPALSQLKRLNLDSNKFSKFPDVVKQAPSLFHLSIDNNPFSEDERARIQRDFNITPA